MFFLHFSAFSRRLVVKNPVLMIKRPMNGSFSEAKALNMQIREIREEIDRLHHQRRNQKVDKALVEMYPPCFSEGGFDQVFCSYNLTISIVDSVFHLVAL